jgi:DMSO reductase anchor subunit
MRLLPVVTLLALLASIVVVLMQGIELATIRSSVQQRERRLAAANLRHAPAGQGQR